VSDAAGGHINHMGNLAVQPSAALTINNNNNNNAAPFVSNVHLRTLRVAAQ